MIPLVDLKAQYQSIKSEIDEAIRQVLERADFVLGEEVRLFEEEIASYCGQRFAIGVASGTDALLLALQAAGVKRGDEVITSPFSFIATSEAICRLGAKPVFCDINASTFNFDTGKIEEKITSCTKAILPVHLFGLPCNMSKILAIAKKHNLFVIEDCAQSFGAEYLSGGRGIHAKKTGSIGDIGCFSFFPAKNLGAYGDAGMLVTNDEGIAEKLRILRNHGQDNEHTYCYVLHGINSRLDTLQAAILRVKLRYIDQWIERRRQIADRYQERLKNYSCVMATPTNVADYASTESIDSARDKLRRSAKHSFNYFTIRVENRDRIIRCFKERGISCAVYYPLCLHLQEVYAGFGYKRGDFPVAEQAQDEVLSLPIYAELTENEIEEICEIFSNYSCL